MAVLAERDGVAVQEEEYLLTGVLVVLGGVAVVFGCVSTGFFSIGIKTRLTVPRGATVSLAGVFRVAEVGSGDGAAAAVASAAVVAVVPAAVSTFF